MTTAVILAGGLGTRLRSVVPDRPKPMALVHGRPFLEYQMDYWIEQGVRRFVLSVGYRHDQVIGHFGDGYKQVPVTYAIETHPLGTGGGVLMAAEQLQEEFLLLNGDTFFEVNLDELYRFHKARNSYFTFTLFRTSDTERYMGMDVDENGVVYSLGSKESQDAVLANGGVYFINPECLESIEYDGQSSISLESEVIPRIQQNGYALYGMEQKGSFLDIGIPDDYYRAEELLGT